MAGDQEKQFAAVAEEHTVDQDNRGDGYDMPAAVAPKCKVQMHPDNVRFVMSLKREELGGTEYLDEFAHKFTPEEIEEMRRLHEEVAAIFREDNDQIEARQAQIMRELSDKGYVEVDAVDPPADDDKVDLKEERKSGGDNLEDYDEWANEAEYDWWTEAYWEKMRNKRSSGRIKFADPGDEKAALGWTVRPHDAEDEEEQYIDEDEDSDEYGELEDQVEDEDKDGDDKNNEDERKKDDEEKDTDS